MDGTRGLRRARRTSGVRLAHSITEKLRSRVVSEDDTVMVNLGWARC